MLEWEELQRKADALRLQIEAIVLERGKTVVVGAARCTFFNERTEHAYDQVAIPERLLIQNTTTKVVIDYKSAYEQWKEEELDVPQPPIKKTTPARAALKLEE
jgi:hypothetical protein